MNLDPRRRARLRQVVAVACTLALTALLVVAAATPGMSPVRAQAGVTPTPTTDPSRAQDPEIRLSAASSSAFAGGTIRYTITVRNPSNIRLRSVVVRLPFNPALIRPIGSDFSRDHDWVSDLSGNEMTVRFGGFGRDSRRSADLVFAVADHLPPGTVIGVRGRFEWERERADTVNRPNVERKGDGRTRDIEVTLIAPAAPAEQVAIPPQAAAGTPIVFFANQFLPNEPIGVWINAPGGIIPIHASYASNERGEVSFVYHTTGLGGAAYGMVIYGRSSGRTVVVPFTIEGEAPAQAPPVIVPPVPPVATPTPFPAHPILIPIG
ncbi:MAG TPA: hypothetical protein PKC19_05905 [Roseiflexaceae bacterium]|nr:hypothetical protein [Roseiflexaceae bacterium]